MSKKTLLSKFQIAAYLFKDKRMPLWIKVSLIIAVMYGIVPTDIVPDFIPGIGLIDDLLLLVSTVSIFWSVGKKIRKKE